MVKEMVCSIVLMEVGHYIQHSGSSLLASQFGRMFDKLMKDCRVKADSGVQGMGATSWTQQTIVSG